MRQDREEDRSIEDTLNVAWSILSELPEALLTRVDNKFIEKYHPAHKKSN